MSKVINLSDYKKKREEKIREKWEEANRDATDDYFEEVAEKNRKNEMRRKQDRHNANRQVIRSYSIKGKK